MLVYYSRTNNTKRMLKKLDLDIKTVSIMEYDGKDKFTLITPTYSIGQVPDEVTEFLKAHHRNMIAVISSGNRNWGMRFARAGNIISEEYKVPLLFKYELNGLGDDIKQLRKVIGDLYGIY